MAYAEVPMPVVPPSPRIKATTRVRTTIGKTMHSGETVATEIRHEDGIERVGRRLHGTGFFARRADDSMLSRRGHREPGHLVARCAFAEGAAALGGVALHREERGCNRRTDARTRRGRRGMTSRSAEASSSSMAMVSVSGPRRRRGGRGAFTAALRTNALRWVVVVIGGSIEARHDRRRIMLGGRGGTRMFGCDSSGGGRKSPCSALRHHLLDEAGDALVDRDPVVARERLTDAEERRDLLLDRKREREREPCPPPSRERLGDRDDERLSALERHERALLHDVSGDDPQRGACGLRQKLPSGAAVRP